MLFLFLIHKSRCIVIIIVIKNVWYKKPLPIMQFHIIVLISIWFEKWLKIYLWNFQNKKKIEHHSINIMKICKISKVFVCVGKFRVEIFENSHKRISLKGRSPTQVSMFSNNKSKRTISKSLNSENSLFSLEHIV